MDRDQGHGSEVRGRKGWGRSPKCLLRSGDFGIPAHLLLRILGGVSSENDAFLSFRASPGEMDAVWAAGWRHFGPCFFRTRWMTLGNPGTPLELMPLRFPLENWMPRKSQRRVLRKNSDLSCRIAPTVVTDEIRGLFTRHATRFTQDIPQSLEDFLGPCPDGEPCRNVMIELRKDGRLAAASFLDIGLESVSSIYAVFDPAEEKRSLGTATMLIELFWARKQGFRWHYPGYATHGPSFYDYKKTIAPYEWLDWEAGWQKTEGGGQ